jgi:signal transduction histidine kinase
MDQGLEQTPLSPAKPGARKSRHRVLKLSQKGLLLVLLPFIFSATCLGLLYQSLVQAEGLANEEEFGRSLSELGDMLMRDLESFGYAGYLALRHNQVNPAQTAGYLQQARSKFVTLHRMIADRREDDQRLWLLERQLLWPLETLQAQAESRGEFKIDQGLKSARALKTYSKLMAEVESLFDPYVLIDEEAFRKQISDRHRMEVVLLFGMIGSVLLSLALYLYISRDTANRLSVLLDNTVRFARGQSLHRPLDPGDELARLDDTFHQMAAKINQASREKQQYARIFAHDVRAPLSSILETLVALGEEQMKEDVSQRALEIVRRCHDSGARLMRLIDDLSDIEQLESGKLVMKCENVSVASLLESSVSALQGLAQHKHISFAVPQTDITVFADADRIVQVLVNLLSNAVKFSEDGSSVTVDCRDDESWLTICVKDTGPGIPASYLNLVFERFQQVEGQSRRFSGGTGLGLAICKEIVVAHHGTIGVESEEGKGSCFWFRLPKTKAAMERQGAGIMEIAPRVAEVAGR